MKMYCISDNIDVAVGLKLTGVEAVVLKEKDEVEKEIEEVLQENDIGVLIVTNKIHEMSSEILNDIKEKRKMPLVITI